MAEPVLLQTFATRAEAEVVQGLLASAGIDSWVASDDAGRAYPFPLAGGVHLVVDKDDYEAASGLLEERRSD
jgi:Putative prokaryotic signal transducing protein